MHRDEAIEREALVEQRRNMLRQIGDAIAWLILGGNHRAIVPLYVEQTHQIPREQGLAGTLLVEEELLSTGRYFVLETDLVRCVGVGDLLVVEANRIGSEPLALEIKSSGEMGVGLELGIAIGTAHSNHPEHERLYQEVQKVLDTGPAPEGAIEGRRADRQMRNLEERTQRVFELTHSGAHVTRRPEARHWKAIANVINQALLTGSSFDLMEGGVYKYAVRNRPDDDAASRLLDVRERIRKLAGATSGNPWVEAVTLEIRENDELSAVVPPVALWELPVQQRAAIICGEVVLGNIREPELLARHLRGSGIQFEKIPGGYRFTKDGEEGVMNELEFSHIYASSAFTGLGLEDVAEVISGWFLPAES